MWPLLIAAAAQAINTGANWSAEKKKRDAERDMEMHDRQEARRQALLSAIGARSTGIRAKPGPPDIGNEQAIGAISNLVGQGAATYMGSQGNTQSQSMNPQGSFNDPSEAIRRRIQNSYDPYGGQQLS
jgi:hypothetical protein